MLKFLIQRFFQPQPHILIISVQFSYLAFFFIGKPVLQISLRNLLHRRVQLIDRCKNASLYPVRQYHTGKNKNQDKRQYHIDQHFLRNQGTHSRYNKKASFGAVTKKKIQLLYQFSHIIIIISRFYIGKIPSILRKFQENALRRLFIAGIVYFLTFPDNNIRRFIRQLIIDFFQIIHIFHVGWIFLKLLPDLQKHIRRHLIIIFQRIGKGSIILIKSAEFPFRIDHINADYRKSDCRQQQRRYNNKN